MSNHPNDLDAFWMPFTPNREFKSNPRLLVSANGMYYTTSEGRQLLDGCAGLWCVNAGHGQPKIVEAIQQTAKELDYAPGFQFGHARAFEFASRVTELAPPDLDHIFFTNSGSEAVDTALKIALAYHRVTGDGSRFRLIGREHAYHGVGFGGMSVGGMVKNRMYFGSLLTGVDHIGHTHNLEKNAYSRGQPEWGAHLADDLERVVALHDGSTIAALIVEPVAGSAGVFAPPKGYLQRLREICDRHGILLIFDEVITGFGRLGVPFAAEFFGVKPDIIACAKGLTNGSVPAGGCIVHNKIYDAFMNGPEPFIELFHGYTYSGHPLAMAAGLAALDVYREQGLFERVGQLEPYWADAVHSLKGARHVIDLRNIGLIGGVELEPRNGKAGERGLDVFKRCYDKGLMVRVTGDTIAMSPPFIIEKQQIDTIFSILSDILMVVD